MPRISDKPPDSVAPYVFHGVDLAYRPTDKEAIGECPFCRREQKFSVNMATGKYRCFVCAEGTDNGGGNAYTFIRHYWEASKAATKDYSELATNRKLEPATLEAWGVVRSLISDEWLIPGYGHDGKLNQLYRYTKTSDRWILFPTPTLGHQLHGVHLFKADKPIVDLCEGPWDGMAMWESFRSHKYDDSGLLVRTGNEAASLLADRNVLAVPGCNTFMERWVPLFAGKVDNLWYDNDHPRIDERTGNQIGLAGYRAMQRVAGLISAARPEPIEINYIHWGDGGYDGSLPHNTDVRDYLNLPR